MNDNKKLLPAVHTKPQSLVPKMNDMKVDCADKCGAPQRITKVLNKNSK